MNRTTRFAATAALLLGATAFASAQYVPAGMQGSWKIRKLLNENKHDKQEETANTCPSGQTMPVRKSLLNTNFALGEHGGRWQNTMVDDVKPTMATLSTSDFLTRYGASSTLLKQLGLDASQIQVITLNGAGALPFDTVISRDPSTLILERCGQFYQALRDGSYKAPRVP